METENNLFNYILVRDLAPKVRTVYHYSNINALQSILGSPLEKDITIWATSVAFLNDPTEFYAGVDLQRKVQKDNGLKESTNDEIDLKRKKTYSLSLSKQKDSLAMWRMYSPNDGVAIGFNFNKLRDSIPNGFVILKCEYDENVLVKKLNTYQEKDRLLYSELLFCLPYICKNKAYRSEQEIRIISQDSDVQQSGSIFKKGQSVPYKNISLKKDLITSIVFSPTTSEQGKDYVKSLLKAHRLFNVKIFDSKIPYRDV